METIKRSQFGAETRILRQLHEKFNGRATKEFRKKLEERGYVEVDLGTSKKCYTFSGRVGIHQRAHDDDLYFGIGLSNKMVGVRHRKGWFRCPLYRAYVKKVETIKK